MENRSFKVKNIQTGLVKEIKFDEYSTWDLDNIYRFYNESEGFVVVDEEINYTHPLLNPESSHYQQFGVDAIEHFEKMFTVEELKSWAKISYYKYLFRFNKKDAPEKELKKMKTYENYYNYLCGVEK